MFLPDKDLSVTISRSYDNLVYLILSYINDFFKKEEDDDELAPEIVRSQLRENSHTGRYRDSRSSRYPSGTYLRWQNLLLFESNLHGRYTFKLLFLYTKSLTLKCKVFVNIM